MPRASPTFQSHLSPCQPLHRPLKCIHNTKNLTVLPYMTRGRACHCPLPTPRECACAIYAYLHLSQIIFIHTCTKALRYKTPGRRYKGSTLTWQRALHFLCMWHFPQILKQEKKTGRIFICALFRSCKRKLFCKADPQEALWMAIVKPGRSQSYKIYSEFSSNTCCQR